MLKAKDLQARIHAALAPVVIGQGELVDQVVISLLASGHILIMGLPGLAKTLLVKSVSHLFHAHFNRVQFTPDLMPSDLIGFEILDDKKGSREMKFIEGPIFSNILLADEINRTPPKTQAALLQAMQEGEVTVMGKKYSLPKPFLVMATQNPIEQEGTYPLPEAQLDRFLFLLTVSYPSLEDEVKIATQDHSKEAKALSAEFSKSDLLHMQQEVGKVQVAAKVSEWMVRLIRATRPDSEAPVSEVKEFVRIGASPRASQLLIHAAKAAAFLEGSKMVERHHVEKVIHPVLRHRILLNYSGESESMSVDKIVDRLLKIKL